ncbi:Por secretion system C-terminal sorting domain-containing protein [Chryseobacterium soldanellicola]|uniref:Por secretion system C-terminal sorting domain-containing protein n=1 Tax=Chryseobacterium soldanellicola TaxID=311333 RepID=A0A1H1F9N7_9FLAO|nr:T9SS type A sorting domain-containing protein [Chryseobacterium soldanellicola]SDQ97783.1 Por secretion system C-terminal sorting domain-containing protein [Chryseobacterium soldanellicola]
MKKILFFVLLLLIGASNAQETTYWKDNFDEKDISDWTRIISSGEGYGWSVLQYLDSNFQPTGTPFLSSVSYTQFNNIGYLHPDEWAISPQIDLTNASGQLKFSWLLSENRFTPSPNEEHYEIYISEEKTLAGMLAQPKVYEETNVPLQPESRSININQWKGKKIYIGIRHHNLTFDIAVDQPNSAVRFDDLKVSAFSGCTTATFGQYPQSLFIPTLDGIRNTIVSDGATGEYSLVQLKAGVSYFFSTSNATIYNTIATESQEILASGFGELPYTPAIDQNIRFYSHKNTACAGDLSVFFARYVRTLTACEQNKVTGTSSQYFELGGTSNQRLAVDVSAPSTGSFSVYGLEPIMTADATTFKITFYENTTSDLPGSVYTVKTPVSVKKELVAGNFNKYTLAFDTPVVINAGKTYWMEVESNATGWQSISTSHFGNFGVGNNDQTGGLWVSMEETGVDFAYNIICSEYLATEDNPLQNKIAYYPNPVSEELNLQSGKKIKDISLYNVAGQKVSQTLKPIDNKLDMRKYSPGIYMITVTFIDGKSETIKVIKK